MKSRTEAVIIGSTNLGEADKIVTFFSLNRGKLRGVAKNARKSFRRFGAGLEPFTHCRLNLYEREHQELLRVEQSEIVTQLFSIACDLERMATGSAILELVREISPEGEGHPEVFHLLVHVLRLLDAGGDPLFLRRIFEIRFLSLLGYQPKLDRCLSCGCEPERKMIFDGSKGGVFCPACMAAEGEPRVLISPGAVGFYYQALRMDLDKLTRLKPSAEILRELDQAFSHHTLHILGKRLKSVGFLQSVCPG
ncbi:MAG: DNA repair protein RecO [Nitrospiraceae bacterium]|nr:DNA repair protein RecO [Nitrospiraceae bacterium]